MFVRNPGSWVLGIGSWVLGHLTQKIRPDPGPMNEGHFSLSASAIVTCLGLLWYTPQDVGPFFCRNFISRGVGIG